MFQNWLDQMNLFLLTHPDRLSELEFLFRLKSWLLMILMGYFLYLIYTDDSRKNEAAGKPQVVAPYYFVA